MDGAQSICLNVVSQVAKYEGTSPEDLQPPLHSAIDTEALERLFQTTDSVPEYPSVEFTYKGYMIHVRGPDEITITDSGADSNLKPETA